MSFIREFIHQNIGICCVRAAVLAAVCWGGAWVVTKGALEQIAAPTLLVIELAVGNLFLWSLLFWRGQHRFTVSEFVRLGTPGLLGLGLSNTFELAGLSLTTASSAALVKSTETILIVIAAWLFLREKQGWFIFLLAFLLLAGVGMVSAGDQIAGTAVAHNYRGDALILAAAVCGAVFYVLTKRDSKRYDTLRLSAAHLAWGLIWAIALLLIEVTRGNSTVFARLAATDWATAIFAGVLEYALPYWLFLIAIKTLRGGSAPFFLTLVPVFSIAGGYLFLGERLFVAQWFGAALVLGALIGATKLTNDQSPAAHDKNLHPTLEKFDIG